MNLKRTAKPIRKTLKEYLNLTSTPSQPHQWGGFTRAKEPFKLSIQSAASTLWTYNALRSRFEKKMFTLTLTCKQMIAWCSNIFSVKLQRVNMDASRQQRPICALCGNSHTHKSLLPGGVDIFTAKRCNVQMQTFPWTFSGSSTFLGPRAWSIAGAPTDSFRDVKFPEK